MFKTPTAGSSHNQSAINRLRALPPNASIGNSTPLPTMSPLRGVAIKVATQRIDNLHTKLDRKIGICVEKFPARRICEERERGDRHRPDSWAGKERPTDRQAARITNKGAGPVCVCVRFCNPAKVDTFCNVKRKLAAVAVGVGFFIGFAWFTLARHEQHMSSQKVHRLLSSSACLPV